MSRPPTIVEFPPVKILLRGPCFYISRLFSTDRYKYVSVRRENAGYVKTRTDKYIV